MRDLTEDSVTEAVLAKIDVTDNPRLEQILVSVEELAQGPVAKGSRGWIAYRQISSIKSGPRPIVPVQGRIRGVASAGARPREPGMADRKGKGEHA